MYELSTASDCANKTESLFNNLFGVNHVLIVFREFIFTLLAVVSSGSDISAVYTSSLSSGNMSHKSIAS